MKYILFILLIVFTNPIRAQAIRHEFTDPNDSVKLQGLRLYLEIDSVYEVSDSSGVSFVLEMLNTGVHTLRLTNPLYDTELNVNPSFWLLPSKKEIKLKEVGRWPNPNYAKTIKPYRLEKVVVSGQKIPQTKYTSYWETDTLSLEPAQQIRYELNLFEQVLVDENNDLYFEPLFKGDYYVIFNVALDLGNYYIRSKPLRFKLRLE